MSIWNKDSTTQKAGVIEKDQQWYKHLLMMLHINCRIWKAWTRDLNRAAEDERKKSKSLEHAGQQIKYEIWGSLESSFFFYFKTKQYSELLSVEVLRAEGRQAEEGNWMIWSTFLKTDMLPYQNKHHYIFSKSIP